MITSGFRIALSTDEPVSVSRRFLHVSLIVASKLYDGTEEREGAIDLAATCLLLRAFQLQTKWKDLDVIVYNLKQHTRCARLHTRFKLDGITQVLATRSRRSLEVRQGKRRDRTGNRSEHSTANRRSKAGLDIHVYLTQLECIIAKTSSVNAASGQVPDQLYHSPQVFYKGTAAPVYVPQSRPSTTHYLV